MLSKRYESTEVDRRNFAICAPRGLIEPFFILESSDIYLKSLGQKQLWRTIV